MSIKETHQHKLISRLRRVEGQIRGIQGMIERDEDCEAVAQQLAAARKALDRTFYDMLACALDVRLGEARTLTAARGTGSEMVKLLAKYG